MADVQIETQEAEDQYRADLMAELWEGGDPADPGDIQDAEPVEKPRPESSQNVDKGEETGDDDPLSGVDPRVVQLIRDMDARLATYGNLEHRLKQAERRVGSLQNSLQEAQTAAQQTKAQGDTAPSKQELSKATTDDDWSALKEEYPEWAEVLDGMDKRFAGNKQPAVPGLDIEAIRTQLQTDFDKRLSQAQQDFEVKLVGVKYPDWRNVVQSKEYTEWLAKQPAELHSLVLSSDYIDYNAAYYPPIMLYTSQCRRVDILA
jgi:TolA-binding protein